MRNRNRQAAAPPADADPNPDPADRELGYLTPVNAYVLIETLRGLYVGLWGLDYNRTIHNTQTLYAMTLIEGFCAGLSACVNAVELANLLGLRCCRRDGRTVESGERPITQQLTYIIFRFVSTAFSALGVGFLGYSIPTSGESLAVVLNNSTYVSDFLNAIAAAAGLSENEKKFATLGLVSLSVSAITARYLSGKKYKLTGGVLREDGLQLRGARQNRHNDDDAVELVPIQQAQPAHQNELKKWLCIPMPSRRWKSRNLILSHVQSFVKTPTPFFSQLKRHKVHLAHLKLHLLKKAGRKSHAIPKSKKRCKRIAAFLPALAVLFTAGGGRSGVFWVQSALTCIICYFS